MSWEWILLIVLLLASLTIYAKDFKLGLALDFLLTAAYFVWFYMAGLNFWIPLVLAMIFLVLLSLSIYFVSKVSTTGGFT